MNAQSWFHPLKYRMVLKTHNESSKNWRALSFLTDDCWKKSTILTCGWLLCCKNSKEGLFISGSTLFTLTSVSIQSRRSASQRRLSTEGKISVRMYDIFSRRLWLLFLERSLKHSLPTTHMPLKRKCRNQCQHNGTGEFFAIAIRWNRNHSLSNLLRSWCPTPRSLIYYLFTLPGILAFFSDENS